MSKKAAKEEGANVGNLLNKPDSFGNSTSDRAKLGKEFKNEEKKKDAKQQMTKILGGLEKFLSGRGEPVRDMATTARNTNVVDKAALKQETARPLPFDEMLQNTSNLRGIVASVDPEVLAHDEQTKEELDKLTPEAAAAMDRSVTRNFYDGISDQYMVRRMGIYRQRARENDFFVL